MTAQLDLFAEAPAWPDDDYQSVGSGNLRVGARIVTSYCTGPYLIKSMSGPCTCSTFVDEINGRAHPTDSHYHLTLRMADNPKGGNYWINHVRADGTIVGTQDTVTFLDAAAL